MDNKQMMLTTLAIKETQRLFDNKLDNVVDMLNAISELDLVDWVITAQHTEWEKAFDFNTCENFLRIKQHRWVRPWSQYPEGKDDGYPAIYKVRSDKYEEDIHEVTYDEVVVSIFRAARSCLTRLNYIFNGEMGSKETDKYVTPYIRQVMLTTLAIKEARCTMDNTLDNIVSMLNAISELNLVDWVIESKKEKEKDYNDCKEFCENYLRIKNHRFVRPWKHRQDGIDDWGKHRPGSITEEHRDAVVKWIFKEARERLCALNEL